MARLLAPAVGLLLLAAGWGIGGWLVPNALPTVVLRSHIQIAPAETLFFGPYPVPAIALSPNGRELVFAGRIAGKAQLFRRPLDRLEATAIPGTEGALNPIFSPDGAWIAFFADKKLKKIALAGGSASVLADAPFPLGGAVWSKSNHIIFTPIPNSGLQRVSADGGKTEQLTKPDIAQGESSHGWPALIDDERTLLFSAEIDRADTYDGANLIALDIASGTRKLLLSNASQPRSLSGNRLSYVRAGTLYVAGFDAQRVALSSAPQPWLHDVAYSPASGAAQFALTENGLAVYLPGGDPTRMRQPVWVARDGVEQLLELPPRPYESTRLAPDGNRVVLQIGGADDDLWVYDLNRKALSRLTHSGENIHPVWSPDSRRIAFSHHRSGPPNLHVLAADGGGKAERLTETDHVQYANSWSLDGRYLAFEQEDPADGADLWIFDFETRAARPFRQTPSQELGATFSPDGRWLAYQSDESGREEVYLESLQGPSRRWQVSNDGGRGAAWSKGGRELLFIANDAVYSVDLAADASRAPSAPRKLFGGAYRSGFQASADGSRILLLRNEAAVRGVGPLVLVQGLLPPE